MEKNFELIGTSQAIRNVHCLIEQVAKTQANVLLLGGSGTGKELVARKIHHLSLRSQGPFVPLNCAALPLELLESELFGHEKGAFTGALAHRLGRFELATAGSLFLDEVGDIPLAMQVKLLRVLQERTLERVGSNRSIKVDVRLIAATHRNLEQAIALGSFREDLYYRLNVFPIAIPPLRARLEDIGLLVDYFVEKYAENTHHRIVLTPDALAFLQRYHWPGNVRELSNLVERLLILFPGKSVHAEDLPTQFFKASADNKCSDKDLTVITTPHARQTGFSLKDHLMQVEISLITDALTACQGITSHAAQHLGVRRTTLVEKMKKYQIEKSFKDKNMTA